jgi:hypothetical protein
MKDNRATFIRILALSAAMSAPALALSNPLVVDLRAANGPQTEASATIFGSGSSVLVNVRGQGNLPKTAAVTLNDGDCAKPGEVAFALSGIADNQSLTQLAHPLADVAEKAKSLVIHQTSSETSPAFACGKLTND